MTQDESPAARRDRRLRHRRKHRRDCPRPAGCVPCCPDGAGPGPARPGRSTPPAPRRSSGRRHASPMSLRQALHADERHPASTGCPKPGPRRHPPTGVAGRPRRRASRPGSRRPRHSATGRHRWPTRTRRPLAGRPATRRQWRRVARGCHSSAYRPDASPPRPDRDRPTRAGSRALHRREATHGGPLPAGHRWRKPSRSDRPPLQPSRSLLVNPWRS